MILIFCFMCTNPVNIINRSKYINNALLHPYLLTVPCGSCPDCINQKVLEIRQRIYYHLLSTFKQSGVCIFDTLTYSEDNVPWFSDVLNSYLGLSLDNLEDFRTFFYRDVTLFLKRLRKWLGKFYPSSSLTYCYFSEYGQDENFTRRPHYHFLFFLVGVPHTNDFYFAFSDAVSSCWSLGFNDSYKNKKRYPFISQWLQHSVITSDSYSDSILKQHVQSISCYLSKYVSKSIEFDKVSESILSYLSDYLKSNYSSSDARILFNRFRSLVSPAHRWSKGFGAYACELYNVSHVLKHFSLPVPDKYNVVVDVPLSVYYKRKFFCYVHKNDDGSKSWRYNEDGLLYLWNKLLSRYNRVLQKFRNLLLSYPDLEKEVTNLLGERSLEYFVFYVVCFRGRVKLPNFSSEWFSSFSHLVPLEVVNRLDYLRNTFPVPRTFYENYISGNNSVSSCVIVEGNTISVPDFCNLYLYSQSYIPDWKDFDLIYLLFLYPTKVNYIRSMNVDFTSKSIINRLKFIRNV